MLLESSCHGDSVFVTLTYSDEHLPENGSLEPRDLTLFLKRLRKAVGIKIRYYAVGEYGSITHRPHYHLAIFGLPIALADAVGRAWSYRDKYTGKLFPIGHVHIGDLTKDSAQYIAGYTLKKLTRDESYIYEGVDMHLYPEFARMSRDGGIGIKALEKVAEALETVNGTKYIEKYDDVPSVLTYGRNKQMPLGRYLKGKLRERMGIDIEKATKKSMEEYKGRLLGLLENYGSDQEKTARLVRKAVQRYYREKAVKVEAREKIYGKKRGLL